MYDWLRISAYLSPISISFSLFLEKKNMKSLFDCEIHFHSIGVFKDDTNK